MKKGLETKYGLDVHNINPIGKKDDAEILSIGNITQFNEAPESVPKELAEIMTPEKEMAIIGFWK